MKGLSPQQIEQFHEEGYVLIPEAFNPSVLDMLRRDLDQVVDRAAKAQHAQGKLADLFPDEPFEARLAQLCAASQAPQEIFATFEGKAHKTAGLFALMTCPELLDIVEAIIGPEILSHPQFNLRAKLPGDPVAVVPWHQDLAYLDPEANETLMVNFWVPLVDAPMETGALQVIPGSHKWGLVTHERLEFGYLALRDESLPPHETADCPLPLGGVLIMQHKLMHRSVANTTGKVRWSVDIRYSDPARPTGRAHVPGFIARSAKSPPSVAKTHLDWLALLGESG